MNKAQATPVDSKILNLIHEINRILEKIVVSTETKDEEHKDAN